MNKETFTREEVISVLDILITEHAAEVYAAVTNEYTDFDGEELLRLIEKETIKADPVLIDSMAMRYRHDFGLLGENEQNEIRTTMKQLWEEVVGLGFYKTNQNK